MLQELLGYNADIMCLQEVDEKAFDLYLQPHLDMQGAHDVQCWLCSGRRFCHRRS